MKKLAALVALLFVVSAHGDEQPAFASGSFATGSFADGSFGVGEEPSGISVPNVIGEADFATADGILEGVALDGFELAAVCSSEPEDEIIRQSIAAGTEVAEGTIINLTPSNGMACPDGGGAEYVLRRRR